MKLKRLCILRWQIFCLQLLLALFGSILTLPNVPAQERITADEAAKPTPLSDDFGPSTPIKPDADSKLPDVIRDLMPSIVRVTRVEQTEPAVAESARPAPFSHVGVVVDSRGYIVIPIFPGPAKHFAVRFANQQEAMAELVAIDDSLRIGVDGALKLGVLKVENPLPVKAISIAASREAHRGERVLLVPSSNSQKVHVGRIQTNAVQLSEGSTMMIQADIDGSLRDFGRLLVSEAGEPIGLVLSSSRSGSHSMSFALPLRAIQPVLQAAIDKPKDVPLVRVTQSQPVTDLVRPVQPPAANSKMPEISGTWTYNPTPPSPDDVNRDLIAPPQNFVVRRSSQTGVDFEYLGTVEPTATPRQLIWEPGTRRFRAVTAAGTTWQPREIFELSSDGNQLSVRTLTTVDDAKRLAAKGGVTDKVFVERYLTEQWQLIRPPDQSINQFESSSKATQSPTNRQDENPSNATAGKVDRTDSTTTEVAQPKSLSYIQPGEDSREVTRILHLQSSDAAAMFEVVKTLFQGKVRRISADRQTNSLIVVAMPSLCDEVEAILLNLDKTPSQHQPAQANSMAIPGTPAAKQLVERLAAQESAAASAANEIRRLQAKGDAIETIAPHLAQLKAHLQTAFELKMQLEELQVKELQARLSRLERQIGQRKELREKIINRRAGELIDGDTLKWNTKTSTFGVNATDTIPKLIDLQPQSNSEVSEAGTRLIEPSTAISAQQLKPSISANAQSQMLDFIRDEAYSHVEDITSLQYAFDVKDDNGWHAEAQFFADQLRFRVNRKDVAGMQVKGKRIDPLTSASAFDGLRQQYLDKNGRLRLKNGCEGASYGIGTPHVDVYSWLRRGPEDLRWDIICNQDLWKERFAEAEYIGAIPENGRTLEIVDFPARLEGQKPCTYRVFFARDLRFFPIKCLRRVSATTETSTTVTVTDFKSIEKGGQKFVLPTTLTYSESRADGVSMKQQRTTTVVVDSLKVNEPIDKAVFTIDDKEAKEVFTVQDQGSIGTQSELPQPPIATVVATPTPAPGIGAIAARLDASAAAINSISVTTDYKKRHVYGLPFDAPIELTLVTKTIIDSEGRLRVETTGKQINIEPDGKSARAYNGRWETVFQNGEARSLTWYESNPPTASIDNFPSLHGIHPREFTTHFQSKSVSEILRSSAAEVAERTMWDDRPVTIVQTTPIQNANDARRYRFWIDQERNVVVRRAIAIRYAEGQPWQEYARIENHDYQEIAPGIWLPNKVKYESLEVTPELTPAKLSWSYEGTNRDWKVNSELSVDTFDLAFPEGAIVNDHRAKLTADGWLNKLQGTWNVEKRYRGKGTQIRESYSASVHGNRMEILSAAGQHAMIFDIVLGEAGPPQQIDLKLVLSDLERKALLKEFEDLHGYPPSREELLSPIFHGIIELNANSFRICSDVSPASRPTRFADDADRVNWTFLRSDVSKAVGLGIDALAAAADAASLQETEIDSLQGTWCFDVLQSNAWPKPIGGPTDSSGRKSEQRWIIDGDRITWTSLDGEQIEVRFTIDPTKTPKQIEFTFLTGPQKGMKSVGIYEPQKGNANYLWLCMTDPGTDAPRPTEVGYSSEKQQSMIGIYPVEKPDTMTVSESLKRFQGEWKMTICDSTFKSFGASQEVVQKWSWVIRGDEILWSRDDDMWKLKLDVDASKSPGELDLTYLTGPFKGAKCLGMFQWGGVDKTHLMIAIQDPLSDAPRPSKFSMDSSIRTGLMILEPRSSNR